MDEAQRFHNAFPFWELHLCENCECLEPWLEKGKKTPNWASKVPLERS